jgi:hypothetical protein
MGKIAAMLAGVLLTTMITAAAQAGPVDKAKNAVDPDCSVGKAVKGAAQRATIGVGNRCKAGETARDTVGLDGKDKKKDGDREGPLAKRKKD